MVARLSITSASKFRPLTVARLQSAPHASVDGHWVHDSHLTNQVGSIDSKSESRSLHPELPTLFIQARSGEGYTSVWTPKFSTWISMECCTVT